MGRRFAQSSKIQNHVGTWSEMVFKDLSTKERTKRHACGAGAASPPGAVRARDVVNTPTVTTKHPVSVSHLQNKTKKKLAEGYVR